MKVLSVLAGVVLTVVLYFGLLYLSFLYGNEHSTQSFSYEVGWFIGLVSVIPVLIFPGSMLTGFLIQPSLEKSLFAFVFYSPGLFFAGMFICLVFFMEHRFTMQALIVYGGICLIWLFSSFLGVTLGYKLRAWMSRR